MTNIKSGSIMTPLKLALANPESRQDKVIQKPKFYNINCDELLKKFNVQLII